MQKILNKINNIQLADFRERTRTYKFLTILAITMLCASFILPPTNKEGKTIRLLLTQDYRAVYNSAFVGTAVAELLVIMLSLFGFYLVRGSIEHDENTGIGQIVAATPTSKIEYLLGKLFSNFLVITVVVMITALISLITFFIRGEVFPVDMWQFLSPFLIIVLPTMFIVSAIAVLFESISFLKGSLGNILYFFIWAIVTAMFGSSLSKGNYKAYKDIMGIGIVNKSLAKLCPEIGNTVGFSWIYVDTDNLKTVLFEGITWNAEFIISRLMYVVLAFIIICISVLFFNRFDVKSKVKKDNKKKNVDSIDDEIIDSESINAKELTAISINFSFFNMLKAELKLILNRLSWWWVITALGLIVACIFSPIKTVQAYILPITWIWPIAIWSSLGNREKYYNTNQIVFSSPFGDFRQLLAVWVASILVTILTGSGMLVRLLATGELRGLLAFIVSSIFISGLALMLGIWSDNRKLFELIYLLIWYMGPMNNMYYLNFMGVLKDFTSITKIVAYFIISVILLVMSIIGRKFKSQS